MYIPIQIHFFYHIKKISFNYCFIGLKNYKYMLNLTRCPFIIHVYDPMVFLLNVVNYVNR